MNFKQKMPSDEYTLKMGSSLPAPKVKQFSTFQLSLASSLGQLGVMGLLCLLTHAFTCHVSFQAANRFHLCNATSESA